MNYIKTSVAPEGERVKIVRPARGIMRQHSMQQCNIMPSPLIYPAIQLTTTMLLQLKMQLHKLKLYSMNVSYSHGA